MEKAKTSEYCPVRRHHNESIADRLEVDAKRDSDGFHREGSGRKPDQPCEPSSVYA